MANAAWKAFFGRFQGHTFEPFLKAFKIYPGETKPGGVLDFPPPARDDGHSTPPRGYVMKNKWVLGVILAAAAVLMYLSVFWKMSEYGPG